MSRTQASRSSSGVTATIQALEKAVCPARPTMWASSRVTRPSGRWRFALSAAQSPPAPAPTTSTSVSMSLPIFSSIRVTGYQGSGRRLVT